VSISTLRALHLSQRQYTLDLLDRFGFADCSPVSMLHVTVPADA
jgi:hypothetical protein